MPDLLHIFVTHPFLYVSVVFASLAAMAFLLFVSGFVAGVGHLFSQNQHSEAMVRARIRAFSGVLLLVIIFVAWEVVRWVAGR